MPSRETSWDDIAEGRVSLLSRRTPANLLPLTSYDGPGASRRTQTVPEAGAASEQGPELVAAGGTAELPRQDSNLRPAG